MEEENESAPTGKVELASVSTSGADVEEGPLGDSHEGEVEERDREGAEEPRCCSLQRSRIWSLMLWSVHVNLYLGALRFLMLPGVFINIVRGPVYSFFVHPLWALVYGTAVALLIAARDEQTEVVVERPFKADGNSLEKTLTNIADTLELHATLSRRRAVWINLVWAFFDIVLSVLTFGLCLGIDLYVFTEVDGIVDASFRVEFAALMAGAVASGISVISQLFGFVLMVLFLCAADKAVRARGAPIDIHDYLKRVNTISILLIFGMLVASIILLSICIHDAIRGKFYHSEYDAVYSSCDPLVPLRCALPFPSSFWQEDDPLSPSGYKIKLGKRTLPFSWRGEHNDPSITNQFDGYSVSAPILWHLSDVQSDELISYELVARSVLINSSTLLVNTVTATFHPHFTEKDYLDDDPTTRLIYSVPALSLDFNTTYLVVVQGLTDGRGGQLPGSDLWLRLVRKYTGTDDSVHADEMSRYRRYVEKVFPVIEALGINLSTVQLAWDFHTVSFSSLSERLLKVTDMAVTKMRSELDAKSLSYDLIHLNEESCSSNINSKRMAAIAYYRVNVPWFLENKNRLGNRIMPSLLQLSSDSEVIRRVPMGGSVGLLIQVPCTIAKGLHVNVTSLVEFGHGLFGSRGIATDDWVQQSANTQGWVVWSADWRGFTLTDALGLWRIITHDVTDFYTLEAAALQSFASKTAIRMLLPELLQREGCRLHLCGVASISIEPTPVGANREIDIEKIRSLKTAYIGHSMGAILGVSWVSVASYARAVALAGGSPITFVLSRSAAFSLLKRGFDLQYYKRSDTRIGLTAWQCVMDIYESSGWVNTERLKNVSLLSINVLGDSTVSHLGTQILTANANASLLEPVVTPLYLIPSETSPIGASAQKGVGTKVMFQAKSEKDFEEISKESKTPDDSLNNVHNCLLYKDDIIRLHNQFIASGVVESPCGEDPCVYSGRMTCNE